MCMYVCMYILHRFWGCTKEEEERFITMISQFAVEPVSDMEREECKRCVCLCRKEVDVDVDVTDVCMLCTAYDDFAYLYGSTPMILHYEVCMYVCAL